MTLKDAFVAVIRGIAKERGLNISEILESAGLHPNLISKLASKDRKKLDIDEVDKISEIVKEDLYQMSKNMVMESRLKTK